MEKKNIGAVIAGVAMVGAFGIKTYQSYKEKKAATQSENVVDESESAVKEQTLTSEEQESFDVNSLFGESFESQETVSVDVSDTVSVDVSDTVSVLDEEEEYFDITQFVKSMNGDKENETVLEVSDEAKKPNAIVEPSVEETPLTTMAKENDEYKTLDPNDPKLWVHFDKEIKK